MTLKKIFIIPFFLTIGTYPFTMNSADIFENARGNGKIEASLNSHVIPDDSKLNSTVFLVSAEEEYKDPQIYSKCQNSQKVIFQDSKNNVFVYGIYFTYLENCKDDVVYLKNGDESYTNTANLVQTYDYSKLFVSFTDYSNSQISDNINELDSSSLKLDNSILDLKQKSDLESKLELVKEMYLQKYQQYENIFLSNIKSSRLRLKYIVPVAGKKIPTNKTIIPNANRGYRSKYTDGVHHGWDIFAARGTPVQALGDGVVVRIKRDFAWADFDKMLWKNITDIDKLTNLDIYRGNQVWLKTADGNVTFYSHLQFIPGNFKEGDFVKAGTKLGLVDRSGVPDKEYKDFHLHFEIQLNPHTKTDNSLLDIMKWPYFGMGKNSNVIVSEQSKIFG